MFYGYGRGWDEPADAVKNPDHLVGFAFGVYDPSSFETQFGGGR
jgi:hypothetical protein